MMIGIGTPRSQSKIARPNLSSFADENLAEISHTTVRLPDLFHAIRPVHAKSRVLRDAPSARISAEATITLVAGTKILRAGFQRIPTRGDRYGE
jgi:hypothetical protein